MRVNPVELLPVASLRPNPANPKRPMGLRYKRGLRAGLERWGFSGVLVVAANEDGTFEVLDGTTRLDELEAAGIEQIPCVVHRGLDGDERRLFSHSHDRHRKVFDEDAVLAQLADLAGKGRELKELALLSGKENLERLLAESQQRTAGQTSGPKPAAQQMASMVLYGPAGEVALIGELLKQVKGKLSSLQKARQALAQAVAFLDWSDEKLLAVLLATVARFGSEGQA